MMGCLAQVAPEYSSIDMWEDVLGGLCACWLLPLALLGGVVLIAHAIGVAWRDRGLERGAVYCSGCRFNLKGCASWNCPECGAHLDEGRVMTPGQDRPVGVVARVLLVASAAVGPLVAAGVLLALVVPVNYETNRTLVLVPRIEAVINQSQIDIQGYSEVAWFGRGRPKTMWLRVSRSYAYTGGRWVDDLYEPPLPESDDALLADRQWERITEQCGLDQETEVWRDEARTDLVLAMRYVAGEVEKDRPQLKRFDLQEHTFRRFEPDPLIAFVEFLLGLVILGLVVRWAVRWHGRVMDVYVHRHARLAEKVNGWIGANREKAGLGKSEQ